jgi:hypothetical protein
MRTDLWFLVILGFANATDQVSRQDPTSAAADYGDDSSN